MSEQRQPATATGFWRCPKCKTPNPSAGYVTACLGCGAPRPVNPAPAEPPSAPVVVRPTRARGRWLLAASWAYAALVLAALGLIHGVGDGWWGVTLLLFMPRWLFLGPVVALAVASGLWRCPWHWALQGAIGATVAGPLMGVSLPVHRLWERTPAGDRLRIATFNTATTPLRADDLERWVKAEGLDVICFQEGAATDRLTRPGLPDGWRLSPKGFVATRLPVVAELPEFAMKWEDGGLYTSIMERLRVRAPSGREFVVTSVHLPTVRRGIEGFLGNWETADLTRHTRWWGREMARILAVLAGSSDVPVLIGGDFNMPADDSTMAALRTSFRFAFEEAGWGYGYTKPTKRPWVRIDHILTGPQWFVTSCKVGPDFGSDHLPLFAEVVLPAADAR